RYGQIERRGVGESDVLDRHPYEAPSDVEGVLPAAQHPRQPVEGAVRIATPHRLVQGGDQVVVLLSRLVVQGEAVLERLTGNLQGDPPPFSGQFGCGLQRSEAAASIPIGADREEGEGLLIERN